MPTYYVSERPDGRIILDRQASGIVLQKIETPQPSIIRRQINGEMIEVYQYCESFSIARAKVKEVGLIRASEGWFRTEEARLRYIRNRLGDTD